MLPCKQREVGASPIASIFPFKLRGEVEAVEMGTLEVSEGRCDCFAASRGVLMARPFGRGVSQFCRRDCEANGLEAESKAACLGDRRLPRRGRGSLLAPPSCRGCRRQHKAGAFILLRRLCQSGFAKLGGQSCQSDSSHLDTLRSKQSRYAVRIDEEAGASPASVSFSISQKSEVRKSCVGAHNPECLEHYQDLPSFLQKVPSRQAVCKTVVFEMCRKATSGAIPPGPTSLQKSTGSVNRTSAPEPSRKRLER